MAPPPPLLAVPLASRGSPRPREAVVCPAASLRGGDECGGASPWGGDGGDVFAEIVVGGPSDAGAGGDVNNGGGSGGGGGGNGVGNNGQSRRVIVRRMDGRTVASFELPPAAGASEVDRAGPHHNNAEADGWRGYPAPQLCWASFRTTDTGDSSGRRGTGDAGGAAGRKMLCVLGAPTTLYVFDPLGDAALLATSHCPSQAANAPTIDTNNYAGASNNANGVDNGRATNPCSAHADIGGGPAGHTIPLPFRARSLFPAANGNGLLIARMPSEEDFAPSAVGYGDGDPPSNLRGTGDVGGGRGDGGGTGGGMPPTPKGMSLPATPRRARTTAASAPNDASNMDDGNASDDEEELSLEGPPEPVRFPDGERGFGGRFEGDGSDDLNMGATGTNTMYGGGAGSAPILFSLHHPLDEVRPLAVLPNPNNNANDDEDEEEEGSAHVSTLLFADANETLVHVATPRLFHGTVGPSGSPGGTAAALPICVTFHEGLQRHSVWTLDESGNAAPDLPLWKATGRGGWADRGNEGLDAAHAADDASMDDASRRSAMADAAGVPSAFADVRPAFALRRAFVEDRATVPDAPDGPNAAMPAADEDKGADGPLPRPLQRHAFLATDAQGRGDLTLCAFGPPPEASGENAEPGVLRCFSLHLADGNAEGGSSTNAIASASHLVDVPCAAARPIRSLPVPLAPFSFGGVSGTRGTGRCQLTDREAMATDILVLRRGDARAGDGGARQDGDDGASMSGPTLGLYRAGSIRVADVALPEATLDGPYQCVGLAHPAGDRMDVHFAITEGSQQLAVRASVSLVMRASPLAEGALRAIEAALVGTPFAELPLLIRADCVRLFQRRAAASSKAEDEGWHALRVVLLRLLGAEGQNDDLPVKDATGTKASTAWEELLKSDFHAEFSAGEGRALFGEVDDLDDHSLNPAQEDDVDGADCASTLSSMHFASELDGDSRDGVRRLVFDALHLLHEDSRLAQQSTGGAWTRALGTLLLRVAESAGGMGDFAEHYRRCLGNSRYAKDSCPVAPTAVRMSNFGACPCVLTCLDDILRRCGTDDAASGTEYGGLMERGLNGACWRTWMALRLYFCLFGRHARGMAMSDDDDRQCHRDRATVLAMLDEGIYHSVQLQEELPMGVVLPLLEALRRCRLDPPTVDSMGGWPAAAFDLVGRNDLAEFLSRSKGSSRRANGGGDSTTSQPSTDPTHDGLSALENFSSMIFPDDNRVREACRLLRSSRPIFLRVPRPPELSDHDYEKSKQERLLLLCRRSIALPLGRGMLTLGTLGPLSAGDQLPIPNIVLAGRVPPANGTLALDMSSCPANFRVWPEFHNGVAAGLRLPRAGASGNYRTINRTWIKFNKPAAAAEAGGGSNNAAQNPPPSYAHGGFLMALGLRGYLSALTTTDLTDYLTQGTITTTVGIFLGMAANKRGSCDPSVSKMLCLHIPSLLPQSFVPMELAASVQSAAVAGIGLLYQGSSHRLMTEFLLNEIGRQPPKDQNTIDREGFALVCGLALGMVNLGGGRSTVSGLEDLRIEERLHRYIEGAGDRGEIRGGAGVEAEGNARVDINRDITAPGATLAIGLMYIKSHNASVAASLELPDTHFLLDYIRPDLLALRVVSKSLILWDDIEPSPEWIDSQIPSIVKNSMIAMKSAAKKAMAAADGDQMMDEQTPNSNADEAKKATANFDPEAVRQGNAYVISGACFSLGLKFAGSGNRAAASAIIERALWFLELRDNRDIVTQVQRPDESTLTTCLCTAALSLAIVMAGTGDLDSFRLFRALRWKCDDSSLYGAHMAFGAAIGLLFLGGGKCALGSTPEDVAMLIAAFYPHFPVISSDNQYHLQALRHLYVLAVHERILEAVDVDSGEKVCVPIELSLANSADPMQASTPFLVSNDSRLLELRSKSDRYYPIVINATAWNTEGNLSTLFVKHKAGHLSYLQDPNGLRSLSMQTGSADRESFLKSIQLFSNDPLLTSFAKNLCFSSFKDDDEFERFCCDIATECMKEEKSEVITMYLKLFRLIECWRGKSSVGNVWDARLLRTYAGTRKRLTAGSGSASALHLVHDEMIALLCESIDSALLINDSMLSNLTKQGTEEKSWEADASLGAFLTWNECP